MDFGPQDPVDASVEEENWDSKQPNKIIERDDLVAYTRSDQPDAADIAHDIEQNFPAVDPNFVGNPRIVAYVGPIEEPGKKGKRLMYTGDIYKDYPNLEKTPGTRVFWANVETSRVFLIIYPFIVPSDNDDLNTDRHGFWRDSGDIFTVPESGPIEGVLEHSTKVDENEFDGGLPLSMSESKRNDMRGVIRKADTRRRVFLPHEKPQGPMFQRILSMSGGTGSLIGRRHFVTAAHVVLDFEKKKRKKKDKKKKKKKKKKYDSDRVLLEDVTMHAGRNGMTQFGRSARISHFYWLANWRDDYGKNDRHNKHAADLGWGVMDRPLGDVVGFFGFSTASQEQLEADDYELQNAGYPNCDQDDAPLFCSDFHIYKDDNMCGIRGTLMPDGNGEDQLLEHRCDTSSGHSGSPLYTEDNGDLFISAVHRGSSGKYNRAPRITNHRAVLLMDMFSAHPRM